jgi:tRNA threonylcarbamoyl adenosine modification protein YeaZ
MKLLALDAALARCSAAVVANGTVLAHDAAAAARGQPALLAPMAHAVLSRTGLAATALDAVAVTVGPGSFAGLRAAIALAQGIALAAGKPVLGVRVAEALTASLTLPAGRACWVAIDSRRGRIFLDRDGTIAPFALTDLPRPPGPVAIAGDAAMEVATRMAARGDNVMLTGARLPDAIHVAAVAARRLAGDLPPLEAQPLYIDPPEAKLPAGGLRPPPAA